MSYHDWLIEREALLRKRIEGFDEGSVTMEHMADLLELTWRMLPDDLSEVFDNECTPNGTFVEDTDGGRSEAALATDLGLASRMALVRLRPGELIAAEIGLTSRLVSGDEATA